MHDTEAMDSLYGDGKPEPKSVDDENKEDMEHTAVVPLKVLQSHDGEPVKEGDEIVVQVVAVHGDEAEVKYAPKKETMSEGEDTDKEIESLDTDEY